MFLLYNDIIHNSKNMLDSIPKNNAVLIKAPNYIIYSSTNKKTERSSNNRSTQRQAQNNTNNSEPKLFKIRTFTSKVGIGKNVTIQGKRITQEAINCIKEEGENWLRPNVACRRPSIQLNKGNSCNQSIQNRKVVKGTTQSIIFREIELLAEPQRHPLPFRKIDISGLSLLAHRPYLWINEGRNSKNENYEYVLLVSSNFINLQTKKVKLPERSYRSQRSVTSNNEHDFSAQTHNILRNICGRQQEGSFLSKCKIYFKVNSASQLQELRQYLQDNELYNYDGIISIRGKHTDTYTIYSLRDLLFEEQKLIMLEEETTLQYQIPLLEAVNTLFVTLNSKELTSNNINKIIRNIKDAKTETNKTNNSHYKRSLPEDEKENMHPNINYSNRKKSNKKILKHQLCLYVKDQLKCKQMYLQMKLLNCKQQQSQQAKIIKNLVRQKRSNSRKNLNVSLPQRQKIRNRSIENKSFEANKETNFVINLQGEFKEKMVKYVKILENQRASIKQVNRLRVQRQGDLDELSFNLTNRIKSKTPFQMVGDLLRNNGHIGRQISKYLNEVKPLYRLQQETQSQQEEMKQFEAWALHTII